MKTTGSQKIVRTEVSLLILEDKLKENGVVDQISKEVAKMPRTAGLRKIDNLQKSLVSVKRTT